MSVRERLYDESFLLSKLSVFPHTYKTLLRGFVGDGTAQVVLRRKINRLCREGKVCKCLVPSGRFGKALLYVFPKDYHVLVVPSRVRGADVVVFREYRQMSKFWIEVRKCWVLREPSWKGWGSKKFFLGSVIRWF